MITLNHRSRDMRSTRRKKKHFGKPEEDHRTMWKNDNEWRKYVVLSPNIGTQKKQVMVRYRKTQTFLIGYAYVETQKHKEFHLWKQENKRKKSNKSKKRKEKKKMKNKRNINEEK